MPVVPRELAEHTLNIDPKFKPFKQFIRRFNEEMRKAIGEEIVQLLAAGFIVEFFQKGQGEPARLPMVIYSDSEFPRYTWHVRRFPCKDVLVLMDEHDERAFLFRIQISTDAELLG